MRRLALVSPLPPAQTGIADYTADMVALLSGDFAIDVFHEQTEVDEARLTAATGIFRGADLKARQASEPYDLAVYQMGNAPAHEFVYEHLPRHPGLLVLHDLVLHHARARTFLDGPAVRAYAQAPWDVARRAAADAAHARYADEVRYTYPGAAERIVAAQLSTTGLLLPYAYPLFRLPAESARMVAVHNRCMAEAVRAEVPGAEVAVVPMPMEALDVEASAVAALRDRYSLARDAFVVASFGLLTREKRIDTVARAVRRVAAAHPRVRLLLIGPAEDPAAILLRLHALGVADRTIVAGRVSADGLAAHIALADAVAHLRYPTARETSAALLRVLAQGRPTVMADLENAAEIPADAVLRADLTEEEGDLTRALLRLAERPALRARLSERARAYVAREHSPARCREAWRATIERACTLPDPPLRPCPESWRRGTVNSAST